MPKPLLSIIVPVWNTSDNVRPMVNSILTQSFTNFELILIDDGSTDNTPSILQVIEEEDDRIRVFTKTNGGPSSARNLGLENAKGAYIQFYDADDGIEPDALSVIMANTSSKAEMIVSGWRIDLQTKKGLLREYKHIQPSPELVDSNINEYVVRSLGMSGTLYNLWNKLFRADIIRQYNLRFREDLRFGEDLLFALEYFRYVKKINIIPDITYHYKVNSESSVFSSSSLVPEYRRMNDEAIIAFSDNKKSPELGWLRWRWLLSYWSLIAASSKNFGEKNKLIRQFQPNNLPIITSMGVYKLLFTTLASCVRISAPTSLLFGWIMKTVKQLIIAVKTLVRE